MKYLGPILILIGGALLVISASLQLIAMGSRACQAQVEAARNGK